MPITFSEQFNISKEVLEITGVFDVILDIDTRVFIDPALLELCTEPEFLDARKKVEKYFSDIITLLRHSKSQTDMYRKRAERMLTFTELSGTCFGYSQNGTGGNAIGSVLRKTILNTIQDLMTEGDTDPVLFELLGVFQEGIGCDRVSDLITFILREDMLKYTQRVTEFAGVDSLSVSFGHKIYKTCRNPYNNKPLLLLPSAILSPLPIADTFDDIDWICQENERVREEINSYFDLGKKTKLHKSQILTLMRLQRKNCAPLRAMKTRSKSVSIWTLSSEPLIFLKIQLANTCGFLLQESIPKNIHYLSHKYHWKPVMTS
jgi:hypothetical protein